MIDTHAHLDFKDFDEDREEVIRRAFDNGVNKIINVGCDMERSRSSVELAQKHENIFASVGFHPHEFTKHVTCNTKHDWIESLKNLAKHEKVVAIGECGLDYFSHTGDKITDKQKENQKAGFIAQINLAKELGLSVVVHCRDVYPVASDGTSEWFGAWGDLHAIISKALQSSAFSFRELNSRNSSKPSFLKFVLHCYSGDAQDTEKFLKLPNVFFSFTGNITYPKPVERAEKLEKVVKMIPLERIMLDTDCPFLAPQALRGKRNEPTSVRHIAERIAEIKGTSPEEVEEITDANAETFFGLK